MEQLLSQFNKKIILCSHSPRRKQILQGLDLDVKITSVEVQEDYPSSLSYDEIAEYLANKKAAAYNKQLLDNEVLLCADTLVFEQDKALGKPKNLLEAKQMLHSLSGATHEVITGCVLRNNEKKISFSEKTSVYFSNISDSEIDYYLNKYNPIDKAGAYGIQEWIGMSRIEKIEGDYYNVMGLPAHSVWKYLKEM